MTRASRWVGCLCLALVVGCGEDLFNDMNMQGDEQGDGDGSGSQDGDGPGTIEGPRSGVDGDQAVSDLSDADAAKFCTWAAEKVSQLVPTPEQLCTIYALSAGDAAQCAAPDWESRSPRRPTIRNEHSCASHASSRPPWCCRAAAGSR